MPFRSMERAESRFSLAAFASERNMGEQRRYQPGRGIRGHPYNRSMLYARLRAKSMAGLIAAHVVCMSSARAARFSESDEA